jgi:GNAT superfamily N-acetyltransferase
MRRNDVNELIVRSAREEDLDVVEEMVSDFVKGHPAEKHPRSRAALRAAYFGDAPVANLIVASRRNRIVGMGQWTLIYDMFWGMYGANAEWLYVRPDSRGLGVAVAIIAEICAQVRCAGGEFLHGAADDTEVASLYERVAMGKPTRECYVSAEAFRALGELAGLSPRAIVRRLPPPHLNRVPPRERLC